MQTQPAEEEGNIILDLNSRTRVLEGKYNLLRDKVIVINQNMIEEYKKLLADTKAINYEIKEIRDEIFKIKETIKHLIKELSLFAKKDDVRSLEKYINIWNPMKFATEKEVKSLIEEKLKNLKGESEIKKDGGKKPKGPG